MCDLLTTSVMVNLRCMQTGVTGDVWTGVTGDMCGLE